MAVSRARGSTLSMWVIIFLELYISLIKLQTTYFRRQKGKPLLNWGACLSVMFLGANVHWLSNQAVKYGHPNNEEVASEMWVFPDRQRPISDATATAISSLFEQPDASAYICPLL